MFLRFDIRGPRLCIRWALRWLMSSWRDVGGLFAEDETDPSLWPPADRLLPSPWPTTTVPPPPHTAGFVELGPLVQLHEGPPACHPNTLLINSILTQLSPGSSQEGPCLEGVEVQSAAFVLASYFPFSFSDLLEGLCLCQLLSLCPTIVVVISSLVTVER